jgi:hypothetical protein
METADRGEEKTSLIQCYLRYALRDSHGNQVSAAEGEGIIDKEYLTIVPKFGEVIPIHLRDIVRVETGDYRMTLSLASGDKLTLSDVGHNYEDFIRVLMDQRNEVTIRDMLMNETVRNPDFEAEFTYQALDMSEVKGLGKVRLYETSLVVMPVNGDVFRIPLSDVAKVMIEDYAVKVDTEFGDRLVLRRMGSELEPFAKALSDASNDLQKRSVSIVKDFLPGIDSLSLRQIAGLMKEGRAAKKEDVDAVDPEAFSRLERALKSAGLEESYGYLRAIGRQEKICIGFKRGLMGDLTGEYVWFLIPIYGHVETGGNVLAMESVLVCEENPAGATYFFRIVSRKAYPDFGMADLDEEDDRLIRTLNRCMIDINFRREPVYLPLERLEEPEYLRYKIALGRLPSLRLIRNLFIGRVVHSSPDQWKKDVDELLHFNTAEKDDSAKWKS